MTTSIFTDFRTLLIIVLIIVATIVSAYSFKYLTEKYIKKLVLTKHIDPTSYVFAKKVITAIIYIIGMSFALVQIPEMKIVGHSLLAGAGILSLVAGLASQQALSNIMSGFLIVMFKPFKINDRITFNQTYTGVVEEINLRQVVLRDFENNRVIVPNSVISTQVVVNANLTETKVCKMIEIGIGYDSDIGKALKIMEEEIMKHPLHIDNRTAEDKQNNVPEVVSRVVALGNSSVTLKAWAYSDTSSNGFIMYCDLLRSIKERFDEEKIEIPYNYQNVIIKKAE
ncbi:mechanosensitive ion channel family protein [Flagellimonas hadalis]|uniref:Mechanosensitive ion channel family protein n=1 Tax=Flagellimonas hadalis TaxID=2597517 RepID=A0A5N5IUC1_9FLAO|nr:mechanosensitive ion channel family protein [Allomuricauda hadalis]KAB5488299.1 mechanosensitive ion channel family protein [Allomuricauda hadalis]RUA19314.1 MAG: mechanosensitive ion channel family protein [Flavobacteriia bacterium]